MRGSLLATMLFICVWFTRSMAQTKPYPGGSGKYATLVWSDEFERDGLPEIGKWTYEKGYVRNKELQYYTEQRKENVSVEKGLLKITARRDSLRSQNEMYPVTSASLTTRGKKEITYGRMEVRARIPSALGSWPAIWTLGTNQKEVGWPACGEIDILEHVGYMPDTLHFNVHTQKYNHVKRTGKGTKIPFKEPYQDFHIYAVEWFTDRIDWYLDDTKVFTYTNEGTGNDAWPFDKPQYLILNLAIGGAWGGTRGVNLEALPLTMLVDYVRIYQ